MPHQTPEDLAIHPRDLSFSKHQVLSRHWLGADPVATAFFNALSASFPLGERFFIDAVRRFRDRASGPLAEQIAAFISQESVHTREHLLFNMKIGEAGYDLSRIDSFLAAIFKWARTRPPLEQLAGTIALEHFTAILAHEVLRNPVYLEGAPPTIQRLWRWHAIEEIEHKAVAFDTFLAATTEMWGFRRWTKRCTTMAIATLIFLREITIGASVFFRRDGIDTPRTWLALLRYLFVRPGLFRKILPSYLKYYQPGFHPWQVDDRALIGEVEEELAGSYATA